MKVQKELGFLGSGFCCWISHQPPCFCPVSISQDLQPPSYVSPKQSLILLILIAHGGDGSIYKLPWLRGRESRVHCCSEDVSLVHFSSAAVSWAESRARSASCPSVQPLAFCLVFCITGQSATTELLLQIPSALVFSLFPSLITCQASVDPQVPALAPFAL